MMFDGATRSLTAILGVGRNAGAATVEFALLIPLFTIIVAGTADLVYWIYATSQLTAAVSAGAQYAEINPKSPTLQTDIQTIVDNANGTGWATSTVNVNNGSSTNCYCPTGSPGNWTWGSPVTPCGSTCAGGGVAGQFVTITASPSSTVSPLFSTYNLVYSGSISRSAIVETQ